MKDKHTQIDVLDFSGGLVTNVPVTGMDTKYTPDCVNVFAEGPKLRKRKGFGKLNTATVAAGSVGNGIFNWIKSGSDQLLVAVFGAKLHKMDLGGTAWDGTFDAISANAASGTPLSSAITHFANFSGTLLMTNESRTHPQRMLTTDASHSDIEAGGSGNAPNGKYIQVWKEHVWILNCSAGGDLDEEFDSIASWTSSGGGAVTQTTLGAYECAKFVSLATVSDAVLTRDIGTIDDDYIVEFRSYFDVFESASGTTTSLGYALMHWDNGVTRLSTRWSDDGLEVWDGTAFNNVGVSVAEDSWYTWKFVMSGGTAASANVDILKDDIYVGVGVDASAAAVDSASDGEVKITATGSTGTGVTMYMDYMYINTTSPQVEYFTDSQFSAWDSAAVPTTPNLVAEPVQPLTHFRLADNAASTVVTDDGSGADNGVASVNTNLMSSTGKIANCLSFTSASSHVIALHANTVTDMSTDNAGTIAFWINPETLSPVPVPFSLGDTNDTNEAYIQIYQGKASIILGSGGTDILKVEMTSSAINTGTWTHLAVTQNATTSVWYVNGSSVGVTLASGTDGRWFNDVPNLDNGRIGCLNFNGAGNANFVNGLIDDFRYYSSALTQAQIDAIYAGGSGSEAQSVTSREGTVVKQGTYSYEFTHAGTGDVTAITQTLASSTALAGQACVAGAWVFGTNAKSYKIRVSDGTTDHDSGATTSDGTWQYKTFEFTPTSGATSIDFKIISTASAATFYVDGVSCEVKNDSTLSDNADRIQRSAIGTMDDWDGTDSGTNDIVTPKDVGLTGSFIVNDRMYVTKKHSIHRFTYTASTPLVDIKQIRSNIGTSSPRSVKNVNIPERGEVVIFLGTDRRLYIFDGFDSTPVSTNIEMDNEIVSTYLHNVNTQALDKVFAVVHDDNPWYEIFLPIGTATVPNYSFVYDYLKQSFWPMSNRNFRAGTESDDGSGQIVTYVQGNTTGYAYLTNSTNSDDGSSINGNWVSPKIGDPTLLSTFDEVDLSTEQVSAAPLAYIRENFTSAYRYSTVLVASTNKHNRNPRFINNYIQFRINDDSTDEGFVLWQLRLLSKGIGHAK